MHDACYWSWMIIHLYSCNLQSVTVGPNKIRFEFFIVIKIDS